MILRKTALMIFTLGVLLGLPDQISATTLSDTPNPDTWVTDGQVNAIACTPSTIYLGGRFTQVGPATGHFVSISAATGQTAGVFPKVDGPVYACASDGTGGWYIGGVFTHAGGLACNNIAHILANGNVDAAWQPNANDEIDALAVAGGTVYAGGRFTSIGGQNRNYLAALDAVSGTALPWNPNASGGPYGRTEIKALAVAGSTVYVGGEFNSIGGQTRNGLAALDAATGQATAWNPNPDNYVYALVISGGVVYAGGYFSSIGGQSRNGLAALDTSNGKASSWNPDAYGGPVRALAVSGGTVYAGGDFVDIGWQPHPYLVALNTTSGAAKAWNPNVNGNVYALAVAGGTVYAGGNFSSIGGQWRNHLAALDAATGQATAWTPNTNNAVRALAVSGGTVYAGGYFTSIGGVARNNLAALDAATGQATAWNPNASSAVNALAVSGGTVYVGGEFGGIGGQTRKYLAALDAVTGQATAWNPNANGVVFAIDALAISGGTVYVGGNFSIIGGQARTNLAALDAISGAATAWDPEAFGAVHALAVSGGTIYAGGQFSRIGGQDRFGLAALDAATGQATAWNPNVTPNNGYGKIPVSALAATGGLVYAGGSYTSIGGQGRNSLAALDALSGAATAWNPNVNGDVYAVAVSGGTVYAAGYFSSIGGQTRNYLAALDMATGKPTAWNPEANNVVNALAASGGTVYAGGYFSSIGGQPQSNFAQFDPIPPPAAPSSPGTTDVQSNSITWAWDDNSLNETGFKVWSDSGTGTPTTLRASTGADTTSWLQSGLKPNTQYTFQVAATGMGGDSARTTAYTTWTLIEPVNALAFPAIDTTSIAVAPANTLSNLTAGVSGIYISNDTAGTASGWVQSAPWVSGGLTPNTLYAFRGRSRNGARISGAGAAGSAMTLPLPPSIGNNLTCDQTTGTVHILGTTFTFSNPAGFGAGVHGGSPYKVGYFRYVWDTSYFHSWAFDGNGTQWSAGTLVLAPTTPGTYYLKLLSYNAEDKCNAQSVTYGPFTVQAMGRLATSATALNFTRASGRAVDVVLGGQPTTLNLILANTGSAPLNFTGGNAGTPGLALGGRCAADFQIAQVTPATSGPLAPGISVTVVIRFAPKETKFTPGLDAALTITTDSGVNPVVTIPLLGDAVPVTLSGFKVE